MSDESAQEAEKPKVVDVKAAEGRPSLGFNHEQNVRLAVESGKVKDTRPLVAFLYDLVRDRLPLGTVETMVREQFEPQNPYVDKEPDSYQFTNGWLAKYAQDVADRLVPMPEFHADFFNAMDQAGLAPVPTCKGWRKVGENLHVYLEFQLHREYGDMIVVKATGLAKDTTLSNTAPVVVPPMKFEKCDGELLATERVDWFFRNIMDKAYDAAEVWFRKQLEEKPAS